MAQKKTNKSNAKGSGKKAKEKPRQEETPEEDTAQDTPVESAEKPFFYHHKPMPIPKLSAYSPRRHRRPLGNESVSDENLLAQFSDEKKRQIAEWAVHRGLEPSNENPQPKPEHREQGVKEKILQERLKALSTPLKGEADAVTNEEILANRAEVEKRAQDILDQPGALVRWIREWQEDQEKQKGTGGHEM